MKRYIAWNKARNEGVVFDNKADAKSATTGRPSRTHGYASTASLALAFFESYGDEKCTIEEVELP